MVSKVIKIKIKNLKKIKILENFSWSNPNLLGSSGLPFWNDCSIWNCLDTALISINVKGEASRI